MKTPWAHSHLGPGPAPRGPMVHQVNGTHPTASHPGPASPTSRLAPAPGPGLIHWWVDTSPATTTAQQPATPGVSPTTRGQHQTQDTLGPLTSPLGSRPTHHLWETGSCSSNCVRNCPPTSAGRHQLWGPRALQPETLGPTPQQAKSSSETLDPSASHVRSHPCPPGWHKVWNSQRCYHPHLTLALPTVGQL